MTTIATSTASTATAYSNQRKSVRLASGRRVVMFNDGTPQGSFRYSDDGTTWTDYGSAIAGWANGSIDVYTDSGGTQRIAAVWKQSGTGGGRTTGYVYAMVGSFNAGESTLTWGAAVAVGGGVATLDEPDVRCHAEGTGGKVHIAVTYAPASYQVNYYRYPVSSSGVLSSAADAITQVSDAGYAGYPHPSIALNPGTKDVAVAWSAGATGAGAGIRFKKATYAAGAWTFAAADVEIDNTRYVPNTLDASGRWVAAGFDGTRWVLGGMLTDGSGNVDIVFYDRDSGDTTTTTHLIADNAAAGARVYYGSLTWDSHGNVYLLGSNGSNDLGYYKFDRGTGTAGARSVLASTTTGIVYVSAKRGYSNSAIGYVYTDGSSSPYNVVYGSISVQAPFYVMVI